MTKAKIIVIWGSEDILNKYLEFLLATKKDWNVVRISNRADLEALIPSFEYKKVDLVVIQQGCHNGPNCFPLQLLQAHPAMKVITINLENNLMDVYTKQNILVNQASDLIGVIEDEP